MAEAGGAARSKQDSDGSFEGAFARVGDFGIYDPDKKLEAYLESLSPSDADEAVGSLVHELDRRTSLPYSAMITFPMGRFNLPLNGGARLLGWARFADSLRIIDLTVCEIDLG